MPRAELASRLLPQPLEVTLSLEQPPDAPVIVPSDARVDVAPVVPPRRARVSAETSRAPRLSAETPVPSSVAPEPSVVVVAPPGEPRRDPIAPLRPPIDLSPRAVAERAYVPDGEGPSRRRAPESAPRDGLAPLSEGEAEARLDGWLDDRADDLPHLARAERMTAVAQTDGTHVYEGTVFRAVIGRDGSISFEDRPGVQPDGISASGTLDLDGMILGAAGQDPYRALRQQLADDNEELIARLEREWRAARMREGLITLRGEIVAIWQSDRPRAARLRAIVARWDEVDESGGGGEARAVIERALCELCPPGTDDAITPAELDALDARREHATERFDPYR